MAPVHFCHDCRIGLGVRSLGRARIVVDWHNYGWSLLEVQRRPAPLVAAVRFLEFASAAGLSHLTVTDALRRDLEGRGVIGARSVAAVLHDKPAAVFTPLEDEARRFAGAFRPLRAIGCRG